MLGYLDDLLIVPLGIKLIPDEVWSEHRERARLQELGRPRSWSAGAVILALWALALAWLAWSGGRLMS